MAGSVTVPDDLLDYLKRKQARLHLPLNVIVHEYFEKDPEFRKFSFEHRGMTRPNKLRGARGTSLLGIGDPVGEFLRDERIRTRKSYVELLREYVQDRPEYKAKYPRQ